MWMAWGTAWASHLCVYTMSLSLLTRWPLPRMRKRVVMRPSTPTGPRAWMRDVLMPTCHPHPSGRHAAAGQIDLTPLPAALRQACGCSSRSCSAQREIDCCPVASAKRSVLMKDGAAMTTDVCTQQSHGGRCVPPSAICLMNRLTSSQTRRSAAAPRRPVRSGSRRRSGWRCSSPHRRCPPCAGTPPPLPHCLRATGRGVAVEITTARRLCQQDSCAPTRR